MIQTSTRAEKRRRERKRAKAAAPARYMKINPLGNRKDRRSAHHLSEEQVKIRHAQRLATEMSMIAAESKENEK